MQNRTDEQFADIVNKALIMKKQKSIDEAKSMMRKAGVPVEIIDKILLLETNFDQMIRKSDDKLTL